jgi:hypothetical protein
MRGRLRVVRLCKACIAKVDGKRSRRVNAERAKIGMAVVTKTPEQK